MSNRLAGLRDAVELAREAFGGFRNEYDRMAMFNEMRLALDEMERWADAESSLPKSIEDNLDASLNLALYPLAGKARPTSDAAEFERWRQRMREHTSTNGFVRGAGRNETTALEINVTTGGPSLGYFSPQAVEPNRSYRFSCWIRTDPEHTTKAGLIAMEFNERMLTGEQPPEFVLADHLQAIHGPVFQEEAGEWKETAVTFRTSSRGRMVHLVLFVDGETPGGRAWFDDLSFRREN